MTPRFYLFCLCLVSRSLMAQCVSNFIPVPCCPTGWTRLAFRCFIFQNQTKTFNESENACQSLGGNLASVHNEDEHELIKQLIKKDTGSDAKTWIGGNDIATEGVWEWTDGSDFGYQAWLAGEPNDYGGDEDCAETNFSDGKWNDIPCSLTRYFVCAKAV